MILPLFIRLLRMQPQAEIYYHHTTVNESLRFLLKPRGDHVCWDCVTPESSKIRISDQSVFVMIDVSLLPPSSLTHLTYRDSMWFPDRPSFRVTTAVPLISCSRIFKVGGPQILHDLHISLPSQQ